jgi:hypothetical protein
MLGSIVSRLCYILLCVIELDLFKIGLDSNFVKKRLELEVLKNKKLILRLDLRFHPKLKSFELGSKVPFKIKN